METESSDGCELDPGPRVAELIEDVIRRRMSGERVVDDAVIRAHPGLMPELGRRLRALRVAEEAERRAESESRADSGSALGSKAARTRRSRLPADSFPGYEIAGEVHRGGQGVVYRAKQTATGRDVALKVMRAGPFAGPHDRLRFEREIRVLATLQHPHIVTIHDSGEPAGHFYYVMDYIQGEALDAYVTNRDPSISARLHLFAKICEAVNAAHLRGVIHRDLKPSNILIDAEGEPHILDFGLAKLAGEGDNRPSQQMTVTGQFVGSLPWASPEQVDGIPERIDLRTDVYSLGVILYHMLTGRFPYDVAGPTRDVMNSIITAVPARPGTIRRGINNEVETIVLKCLSKEGERRYQSAGELARDVRRYLSGEPIEAKRDST